MYEILYIIPAPFTEKDVPKIKEQLRKLIEELGGRILKEEDLGSKKLAYPIKQVHRGFYNLANFEIEAEKLVELDGRIKLTPEILRHMTVKVRPKPAPRKKIEKKLEEKKSPAKKEESSLAEAAEDKEKTPAKGKKIDLKKLGKKIDDLFKI